MNKLQGRNKEQGDRASGRFGFQPLDNDLLRGSEARLTLLFHKQHMNEG